MVNLKSAALNVPYYTNYNPKGFDAYICDDKKQLYAVFDGMGTDPGARWSADKCVEIIGIHTKSNPGWQQLQAALQRCIDAMSSSRYPLSGCTATIASVFNDELHFAHVGDSRLYVVNAGRVKQITADEGVGNVLHNYVGLHSKGITQAGLVYDWQKFMLCTDGVTGDWRPQLLSDQDVELALAGTPNAACEAMIKKSTKEDDKTIIVVGR